jgi:hypothetical protein
MCSRTTKERPKHFGFWILDLFLQDQAQVLRAEDSRVDGVDHTPERRGVVGTALEGSPFRQRMNSLRFLDGESMLATQKNESRRMPRSEMRRITPEFWAAHDEWFGVWRLDHERTALLQHPRRLTKQSKQRIDGKVLNDVRGEDRANARRRDGLEAFGDSAQGHIEAALPKIGDGALVQIEAARRNALLSAKLEEFATATSDVDCRLGCGCAVCIGLHCFAHFGGGAPQAIFEAPVDEVARKLW